MSGNQVFLSGCCYRSIDITASDSGNAELGAQHTGLWAEKYPYNNLSQFKAYKNMMGPLQLVHTAKHSAV